MNCVLLSAMDWKLVPSFHCQCWKFIASDYISFLLWFYYTLSLLFFFILTGIGRKSVR